MKICRKKIKKRMIWLFNDILIYASGEMRIGARKGYPFKRMIDMHTCTVTPANQGECINRHVSQFFVTFHSFLNAKLSTVENWESAILLRATPKSWYFIFSDPEEQRAWLNSFKKTRMSQEGGTQMHGFFNLYLVIFL